MKMGYGKALNIYDSAISNEIEKEKRDKRWMLYTSLYPLMMTGQIKVKEFSEFCDILDGKGAGQQQFNDMEEDEALREIEELERRNS